MYIRHTYPMDFAYVFKYTVHIICVLYAFDIYIYIYMIYQLFFLDFFAIRMSDTFPTAEVDVNDPW